MIEIEIPQDIEDFEPKLIGPFSTRQLICVIGAAITSLCGFFILNKFFDNGLRIIIPMVLDLPWFMYGYWKPYGMKFEDYVKSQLYTTIIPPKKRKYKTENLYDKFDEEIDKEIKAETEKQNRENKEKEKKKGGKKK